MCPPADDLLGFLAGELSQERSFAVEVHMDACADCRAAVSDLVHDSVPAPRFGRYQIETVIGDGGMGIVYRAFDPQLERAVAIKVVKTSGDDEALRVRLVREAQSLARLSHPNVCQVYDVGRDGEEVWVAMELIDGVHLRSWAATHTVVEIEDALVSAARGLAAVHAVGLIHRDVKPENVLVTSAGRTVVTDFGLARSADASLTSISAMESASGTPAYMAPEQLTAATLDERVDQFAWAVMAWELLTDERPFPVEAAARLAAIRVGVTPPARLAVRVARVLTRALSSAARDRFASMEALLEALSDRAAPRSWRRPVAAIAAVLTIAIVATRISRDDAPGRPSIVAAALVSGRPAVLRSPDARAPAQAPAVAPVQMPVGSGSGAGSAGPEVLIGTVAPPQTTLRVSAAATGSAAPRSRQSAPGARIVTAPAPDSTAAPPRVAQPPHGAADRAGPAASRAARPEPARSSESVTARSDRARSSESVTARPGDTGAAESITARPGGPGSGDSVTARPDDTGSAESVTARPDPIGTAAPRLVAHFDRARAERILADCRFPVDPARPERVLATLGAIIDWGPITGRMVGRSPDGQRHLIYEIQGRRDLYRIDASGMPQLGVLNAKANDLIVVCPSARTPPSIYAPPRSRVSVGQEVYAFAPADVIPRIASDLRDLAPLHVSERMLRTWGAGIPPALVGRTLLVWAQPARIAQDSWDMNGWTVDVADIARDDRAQVDLRRPIWLVVDRCRVEGSPGNRHVIAHGLRALPSLLR